MPITSLETPRYKSPKESVVTWDTWREGLNLLLRENELKGSEASSLTNLLLVGSGVPTKRWGSRDYFLSAPTANGQARFVMPIKDANSNQQVLAFSDYGFLTKKSGVSYTMITGASWPSGSNMEGTQLGGNAYLVSTKRELVRYDFSSLTAFATLATPTSATVSNLSGVTGTSEWSWRITAMGKSGGETLGSTPVSLVSLPDESSLLSIYLKWTATSAASGDILGYNIYRGTPGNEAWVGGTEPNATSWLDTGKSIGDPFRVLPVTDSTGGATAKYILRFQDRLIIAGIPGQPTKILISGRWPFQERFDWYSGGGFILIEPDSGEDITGLGIHQEKLVVFKENSVWQVTLNQITYGQYVLLDPRYKLLTASQGCSSHKSIVPVENDLMFANRKGIYILRYEPQLLTVLNANEISAKIRPFFEARTNADLTACSANYIDKKYVLSFPAAKKTIVFDRERLSFTGPWTTPFGINHWADYVDSNGNEHWIAADTTDPYISEFKSNFLDDKGTAINTLFKSKKEDFNDWTLFKTINEVYMNFRSTYGNIEVSIYLEERNGNTTAAKAFTISSTGVSSTAGFGTDLFGLFEFGLSENSPESSTDEVPVKAFIYKSSRNFQVEVQTSGKTDSYELLGIKAIAIPQARGNSPSGWAVT